MFKSVRIQNFRQFRDLKLDGLAQINLITGANDTGKTSLLEALFLLDYPIDPSRVAIVARFRGIERLSPQTPELWDWLFHNRDTSMAFELSGEEKGIGTTRLRASISGGGVIPTTENGHGTSGSRPGPYVTTTEPLPALVYDLSQSTADQSRVTLRWTSQGLALDPDIRNLRRQGFYLPDSHYAGRSEAVRLSQLIEAGRESALTDALKVIDPRLRKLTLLDLGEGSSVYADLGAPPLVPLPMMGHGFGKLLTILAGIILKRDGPIFLIDDIGNGFHYSVLPVVWKAIISAAVEHSAQIFATTHSWECIEAAVKASEGHEGILALFRLERHKDDIRAVDVEDEGLRAAVDFSLELR